MNTQTTSDIELLQLFRLDKKLGCEMLYKQYACLIYGFILRTVSDRDTASDILTNTFTEAWKQIEHYDPAKCRAFTWMMNIARGILNNHEQSTFTGNAAHELVLYNGMGCAQAANASGISETDIKTALRRALQINKQTS